MSAALLSYNQEVVPMFLALATKKEILKDFAKEDPAVQKRLEEIKATQAEIKQYIEDKESELVREIKALETDIKLAVKAAAKGTNYKPKDLKAFFKARADDKVEVVVGKGELFSELESEIS